MGGNCDGLLAIELLVVIEMLLTLATGVLLELGVGDIGITRSGILSGRLNGVEFKVESVENSPISRSSSSTLSKCIDCRIGDG